MRHGRDLIKLSSQLGISWQSKKGARTRRTIDSNETLLLKSTQVFPKLKSESKCRIGFLIGCTSYYYVACIMMMTSSPTSFRAHTYRLSVANTNTRQRTQGPVDWGVKWTHCF